MGPATLGGRVSTARERLVRAGIHPEVAALDAELLARHVLGWERATFLAERCGPSPDGFACDFDRVVSRRERREPVAYIMGRREFWGLELEVSPDVLIPRPETELVVEEALACLTGEAATEAGPSRRGFPRVVDVGTGSGCLAIALAHELPGASVVATDLSAQALAVAGRNAARHGLAGRIEFRRASLLDGVGGDIDVVVSNPPYVPAGSLSELDPEVANHEPEQALVAGLDGLDAVRALLLQAEPRVRAGGWLVFELGFGQDQPVRELVCRQAGLELARVGRDLQGIPRVAVVRKAGEI